MIYYLAGLPRSGSTLLGTLLSQHPRITVTATSSLSGLIGSVVQARNQNISERSQDQDENMMLGMIRGMVEGRYSNHDVTIDKSRAWANPNVIKTMNRAMGEPIKIIATVRALDECMASFVDLKKPESVRDFVLNDAMAEHLRDSWRNLKAGWDEYPEQFHLVEYDHLVANPQQELYRVCRFLGVDGFSGVFTGLKNVVPEDDEQVWNAPGLHDLKPEIEKTRRDAKAVLGSSHDEYVGLEFWRDGWREKPQAVKPLDRQLKLSMHGRFAESRRMLETIRDDSPQCDRAAFNAGWFAMMDGDLQQAGELLDRGRRENVFGNKSPPSSAPIVEPGMDVRGKTVLLHGEGGFGDEIINVRFARRLQERGAKVVVTCQPGLAPIFNRMESVDAVVSDQAVRAGVYHDYRIPAMSAPWILNRSMAEVNVGPYLRADPEHVFKWRRHQGKIGICYQGNPQFEHEQHRLFPRELLDDCVDGEDIVLLQYGENPELESWEDTAGIIANLSLVITSCTSVAHMAGALGKPTWIVTPVLPYYIWARPGNKTVWYDSVTLFRQSGYGDWKTPFDNIKEALRLRRRAA